jgi:serine/threonine-protein kinase HipA
MTNNPLPTVINRLNVLGLNQFLGILTHGSIHSFLYDQGAFPVSLTMDIRLDPYNSGSLHPIFYPELARRLCQALYLRKVNALWQG